MVLQRGRTNKRCVCVYEIYHKVLAHEFMESKKSPDVHSQAQQSQWQSSKAWETKNLV